jgi:hypothetical protein
VTTTSNIFVGLSAWAPSTSYTVGNRRSNGGNAYQCTKSGTSASSGGPSGTGASITDGTATWKFLASVDYITVASWASGIPGTLTQPVVGQVWDCGAITTTAGTEYFSLSGHTTSSVNTITLKAAPGESFRDFLFASPSVALAFSSSNGVRFVLPNATGSINYVTVSDANVIFDGLQFQDPDSSSNCSIIAVREPGNLTLRHSIIDGYCQPGGTILDIAAPINVSNCLFVDRQASSGAFGDVIQTYNAANNSSIVNCSFIAVNGGITTNGCLQSQVSGVFARNCVFVGYSNPVDPGGTTAIAIDHSATDSSSFGSAGTFTNGTGNLTGITPSNQFVSTTTDFRLKLGSSLIVAGVADTTDIPTSDDIAGHTRLGWDPGAWEYSLAVSAAPSLEVLRCAGQASLTPNTDSANGSSTFAVLRATGTALNTNGATGSGRAMFMLAAASAIGQDQASAVCTIGFSTSASAALTEPATAAASFFAISAVGRASLLNAAGLADVLDLAAVGIADQLGATVNVLTLSCVATAIPNLLFVGVANIDWFITVAPLTSSTNASASGSTFLAIRCAASAVQRDLAAGLATIPALSVSAAIGSSCSAVVSFFPISVATATVAQANAASGLATIEILALPKPVPQELLVDGVSEFSSEFSEEFGGPFIFLAADGSGLLLAADVFQPNITSQTFAAGLATLPSLSCSAQALQQIFWSGSVSAFALSASGQAQQIEQASGRAVIPALLAAATAVQQDRASGTASLERLSAAGSLGQSDAATGLATIPSLSALGAAQSFDRASAASTALTLSATATAAVGSPVRAAATLLGMSASGTASFVLAASGSATFAISASVRMGQVVAASASASLPQITASVVANQSMSASGSATIPTVTGSGAAVLGRAMSGVSSFLPMAAAGTMLNTVVPAQALASFFQITASGAAFLHPNITSGSGTISFSASGEMMSEVEAAVLVELEQIVAAHAKLWITPIGYEQGDQVIWWAD